MKKITLDILRNFTKSGYMASMATVLMDGNKFTYDGIILDLPITICPPSMRSRFIKKQYETGESNLISRYLTTDDVVLELGSCIGYISILTSKILGHKKHVVLEINKRLLSVIENNKRLNKAIFTLIHGAISQSPVFFKISKKMTTSKASNTGRDAVPIFQISQLEELMTISFNTLICDIEGGEYQLFREEDLSAIKKIFIEWHNVNDLNNRDLGRNLLISFGFKLRDSIDMNDFFVRK